jgi:type I restriction enzyme R subunit
VTGRESFRQVILLDRMRTALRQIHRDDRGAEWLDEGRISQATSQLTRPRATSLRRSTMS